VKTSRAIGCLFSVVSGASAVGLRCAARDFLNFYFGSTKLKYVLDDDEAEIWETTFASTGHSIRSVRYLGLMVSAKA